MYAKIFIKANLLLHIRLNIYKSPYLYSIFMKVNKGYISTNTHVCMYKDVCTNKFFLIYFVHIIEYEDLLNNFK